MGNYYFESHNVLFCFLITCGMQLSVFFLAYFLQIDLLTDIAGTSNFLLLAWLTYGLSPLQSSRQLVITILITAWAIKLGTFLLYRVCKRGHDQRFDEMRQHFFRFLGFWIFQIIWVFVVSLPVIFVNSNGKDADIGSAIDVIALILFSFGFIVETIADYTRMAFNSEMTKNNNDDNDNNNNNSTPFLQSSVWSWSRHPNYFGEILLWFGIFIFSIENFRLNDDICYISILSPIMTAFLLMFLSGIPLSEKKSDEKYGNDERYLQYKRSTPPLCLCPPSIYLLLPTAVKTIFCCEFSFYTDETLREKLFQDENAQLEEP